MLQRKTKMGRPRKTEPKLDHIVYVGMYANERALLEAEANRAGRGLSEQVMYWLRIVFADLDIWRGVADLRNPEAVFRLERITLAKRILLESGWRIHGDDNYTGDVMLAPGVEHSPSGGFIKDDNEPLPDIDSRSIEKTLKGMFTLFDIPAHDRPALRRALLRALVKTVPATKEAGWKTKMPQEAEQETAAASPDKGDAAA
jgi:hypothetical protein